MGFVGYYSSFSVSCFVGVPPWGFTISGLNVFLRCWTGAWAWGGCPPGPERREPVAGGVGLIVGRSHSYVPVTLAVVDGPGGTGDEVVDVVSDHASSASIGMLSFGGCDVGHITYGTIPRYRGHHGTFGGTIRHFGVSTKAVD